MKLVVAALTAFAFTLSATPSLAAPTSLTNATVSSLDVQAAQGKKKAKKKGVKKSAKKGVKKAAATK